MGVCGWPIVRRLRAGRDADRLEAHAQLAVLVAADASAAEFAREECLQRAADDPGAADPWFDVANEILAATKTRAATPYP